MLMKTGLMGPTPKMGLAEIVERMTGHELGLRVTAYDGSIAGPDTARYELELKNAEGARYLVSAPGELGLARAYVAGDLEFHGVHPGDPYEGLKALVDDVMIRRPAAKDLAAIGRSLPLELLRPIAPPPQEALPRWRRIAGGLVHSRFRDADAISHHYDVSNAFYELVLGDSMTYTCAYYPGADATLEDAQQNKYRLVFDKLRPTPGDRLLDVGCGWGSMVRYAAARGVHVIGITLSREQAAYGRARIEREGLGEFAEIRHGDYRDITETGFDAVSSIGLTEHIGVDNYPAYFDFLRDRLRDGGLLLNHCITRPTNNSHAKAGAFIDRYVFPDGELTGSGTIVSAIQNVGLEVRHEENLREHYAMTLRDWNRNLVAHWDDAVAEVGESTARLWGLYMAASRIGFERRNVELHQVLAVKPGPDGTSGLPLRQWWNA